MKITTKYMLYLHSQKNVLLRVGLTLLALWDSRLLCFGIYAS